MSLATAELPADPAALRAFALACQGELKAVERALQYKTLEIEKLKFQLAKLRRMQFGRSSERINRQIAQLELRLEELESAEAEADAKADAPDPAAAPVRKRNKPGRKPLPDHLPREEVVHQPAGDGAGTCPECGRGMSKLGEDITEVLDYVPGHFQVIRHVRPKYACAACEAITQAPARNMTGFSGFLQADGYSGFEALYNPARRKPGPIIEVACWAHCRRKIFDVWETTKSPIAKQALDRIAAVYVIEDKARFAPAAERVEHRKETATLLDAFFTGAKATEAKRSAKSALAEAFRYIIKRREALVRFVTDGRLEADNNIAENAMRKIALGRRNYLFAGSDSGGERAAAIYTLVATARLNGLNPEAYLKDILTRIADGHPINRIDELMPWRMA